MDAPAPSYATNHEEDFGLLRQDFPKRRGPRRVDGSGFDEHAVTMRREQGWRLRLGGSIPRSLAGRLIAGSMMMAGLAGTAYGLHLAKRSLTHDERLAIPSSKAIEITGNNHLTRAQLLSVFGEDVDRNLLTVPLENRRAELEQLPWVEHATVMRLLPNRIRVAIKERAPVAFVRQGGEIGLVDAHGVLLDMADGEGAGRDPAKSATETYSFPVLTGISAKDPASVRAARMKLYLLFTGELDEGANKISSRLSEVDLTDPEDAKVLMTGDGVLIHLGDKDFLKRYQNYEQHLAEWKTKYPKMASADMRYDSEVVLQMAAGAAVPVESPAADDVSAAATAVATRKMAAAKKGLVPAKKATPAKHGTMKPVSEQVPAAPAAKSAAPKAHLQESFDVKGSAGKGKLKVDPQ